MPGLVTSPARSHASGSRQTTSPHSWWRPTGVPVTGVPDPATKGNRPHACAVVAWYSGADARWTARPAYGIFQPQGGGISSAAVWFPVLRRLCSRAPGRAGGAAWWADFAGRSMVMARRLLLDSDEDVGRV